MITRTRHLLFALVLSSGLAGCGGTSSGSASPGESSSLIDVAPTSTGPVGGKVTPIVSQIPWASRPRVIGGAVTPPASQLPVNSRIVPVDDTVMPSASQTPGDDSSKSVDDTVVPPASQTPGDDSSKSVDDTVMPPASQTPGDDSSMKVDDAVTPPASQPPRDSGTVPVGGTTSPITWTAASPATSTSPVAFVSTPRFASLAPGVQDAPTYNSKGGDYDVGSVVVSTADKSPFVFLARLHGEVWYPDGQQVSSAALPDKYPVVVFLHGKHGGDSSSTSPNYRGYEYLANDLAAHGYVVLSIDANDIDAAYKCKRTLVSACGDWGDADSQSRGQLVLATLDKFMKFNDKVQTITGLPDSLAGKIDFDRIGIMGDSSGATGVNSAIQLNATRIGVTLDQLKAAAANIAFERDGRPLAKAWLNSVWFSTGVNKSDFLAKLGALIDALNTQDIPEAELRSVLDKNNITLAAGSDASPKYTFKAVLSLAPTDRTAQIAADIPFAVLLPSCDGTVNHLSGAAAFDSNRFSTGTAPRFQIVVRGANHNYFNAQWTTDDYPANKADYCYLDPKATSSRLRLVAEDQRSVGSFVIDSFMRRFVGDESAFAPYWNGSASLPAQTCPGGKAPCDSRVALTVQTNGQTNGLSNHKLIAPFDDQNKINQPYDTKHKYLQFNGGPLDLIDTTAFAGNVYLCAFDLALKDEKIPTCTPAAPADGFFGKDVSTNVGGLMATPDQLLMKLTSANMSLKITLKEPVAGTKPLAVTTDDLSTTGYDTLSFRIAMIRPAPATAKVLDAQDVTVTLTDSNGVDSLPVNVSDFSDALDSSMGLAVPAKTRAAELLNMVAIPLVAFKPDPAASKPFDPAHLKKLTMMFANAPKDNTGVALTDVQLQNFGRTPN